MCKGTVNCKRPKRIIKELYIDTHYDCYTSGDDRHKANIALTYNWPSTRDSPSVIRFISDHTKTIFIAEMLPAERPTSLPHGEP